MSAPSTRPFWLDTVTEADFHPPGAPHSNDVPARAQVAIIGGGIVGLACGVHLTRLGLTDVVVLERAALLGEASGGNGGGLWPNEMAAGAGAFHELASRSLNLLRTELAGREAEVGHCRPGVLVIARSTEDAAAAHADTLRRSGEGLTVEWLDAATVCRMEPALAPPEVHGAAWYPGDDHINPARLGAYFAREFRALGGRIATDAPVRGYEDRDHLTRLLTDRGHVDAVNVVVAGGAWARDFQDFLGVHVPVIPAKGQLVAFSPAPIQLNHQLFGGDYGVIPTGHDAILAGGTVEFVDYDATTLAETRAAIRESVERLVPALAGVPITHHWARFRPHAPDELPLVGACQDGRRLVAAGHYRNGLLLGSITGRIIAEIIAHGECTSVPADLLEALSPHRFNDAGSV